MKLRFRSDDVPKLTLVCLAAGSLLAAPARAQAPSEYQVKAVFLYNFAKFVEWPEQGNDPFDLCIVGDDPFGRILEDTVKGKTLQGRAIGINRIRAREKVQGCQIAFIGAAESGRTRWLLDSIREPGTLTVGESPGFARDGGIINFVIEDSRVHFEINVDAARRAHLQISSKLLSLAKIVTEREHGRGN